MAGRSGQFDLGLREKCGWGGRRVGAGRPRGAAPPVPHCRREGVAARFPAHVTVRLRPGLPSLRTVALVRALERSFTAARNREDFRLVHYALQTTHAHLLVEATAADALGRGMKALGARIARALNRTFRRRGPVLAERFHLHVLRSPREVRNALAYVLLNARHHARWLVNALAIDPASSGRWFDRWRRRLAVDGRTTVATPVAPARTWLLTTGWRRHGLIDPEEIPGSPGSRERHRQVAQQRLSPNRFLRSRRPPMARVRATTPWDPG